MGRNLEDGDPPVVENVLVVNNLPVVSFKWLWDPFQMDVFFYGL